MSADADIEASTQALVQCVQQFRDAVPGTLELEARLGVYTDGNFRPGVSKKVFEDLERDLEDSTTLIGDLGWMEHVDYHYTTKEQKARTRVEFDREKLSMRTTHTVKQVLRSIVFRRREEGDEAFRVATATEEPLVDPPKSCLPTFVRIKQRRRFQDVRNDNVVWSYELSRTWSATSRSAAEYRQQTMDPVYEVECELHDMSRAYIGSRKDEEISTSLLMKAKMLLGESPQTELDMFVNQCGGVARKSRARTRNDGI